jgi:hypothetical protein
MHDFVYRLVERLTNDGPPLSRNRHFHTFSSPEGRSALRIARRIRSVAKDIARAPAPPSLSPREDELRLTIELPDGVRTAFLKREEWEILRRMPIVKAALGEASGTPTGGATE